jgi:hypothetical protein
MSRSLCGETDGERLGPEKAHHLRTQLHERGGSDVDSPRASRAALRLVDANLLACFSPPTQLPKVNLGLEHLEFGTPLTTPSRPPSRRRNVQLRARNLLRGPHPRG